MAPAETHARTMLESITEPCYALDRSLRFTYMNEAAERVLGQPSSELVGKELLQEFPCARGSKFEYHFRRALAGDRADFVAYYAPHRRWYEVHAYPSAEGVSIFFQDVTERRRAEEDYRHGRDQMELVVRGANVGIWYCTLPFDELDWDDTVRGHFHVPRDATVTLETLYERLHSDDRPRAREALERTLATGEAYDIDLRTLSPDGRSLKWIRTIGRVLLDDAGVAVRFDGISIDVSDRKEAELAMEASEERYRVALRATNDVIWDWDLTTDHVRWNEALATRFGFPIDENATAEFWKAHIHPADRDRVVDGIHRIIDDPGREHWQDEYRFLGSDGTYADVLDRGYVLRAPSGKAVRMIGAMQDLTDRKRVERERERMIEAERAARAEVERQSRLKDEFLASLSHELRTPLNAILGWSQILLSRELAGSKATRGLEVVERNARAQAAIIDELLDMSRLMAGKVRLDMRPVDLVDVIASAVETARPAADAKNVTLDWDAGEHGAWVSGDPARLQQVLWNLLSNAIKFTPSGGSVQVRLERSTTGVDVRVSDTGEGIRPEFLPYVFERFRQADASSTRRHGGLGLGLSIVKQLVELHGGSVDAASRGQGQGAAFVITLPALPSRASHRGRRGRELRDGDGHSEVGELASRLDIGGLRVLVVDDDDDARAFVAQLLEDRDAVVSTAASAEDALRQLRASTFDVLVSDIGMPHEDGYTLIRRVRALGRGHGGDIPAIALTAYARAEDRVRAVAAGFLMHVAKPLEAAELVAMVAGAAGRIAPTA